jgi:hypothetical protein
MQLAARQECVWKIQFVAPNNKLIEQQMVWEPRRYDKAVTCSLRLNDTTHFSTDKGFSKNVHRVMFLGAFNTFKDRLS